MARGGGFLSRIGRVLRNVVAPPRERERPAPPTPPPPPTPKEPRSAYRNVWREQRGKGDYKKNLAVFHSMVDPIEDDPNERLILWESFIRNINKGGGRFRRQSSANMFWRDSGIDPTEMDWRRWREAMGYTGKNRSRTA
jgi:hypothetical protein